MKYAHIDKATGLVLAWMDTEQFGYAMPPADELVDMDAEAEFPTFWPAQWNGTDFVPYVRPYTEAQRKNDLVVVKTGMRQLRAPMLDALTGIAGRAVRAGNEALALEADAMAEQLLDITDDQALNEATNKDAMEAAGVAAYQRIAAAASPTLRVIFKEVIGA